MFKTSQRLLTHKRKVHERDYPYNCSKCTKGFFSPIDLEGHINANQAICVSTM